jgi:uncharacterized protein (TIGR02246 family)
MKSFSKRALWTTSGLTVFGVLVGLLLIGNPPAPIQAQFGKFKKKIVPKEAPKEVVKDDAADDRAAIQKAVRSFVDAFEKGDAKAVAAHWTENGEYISDDGTTLRGRAAIEKEYAANFNARKTKVKIDIEVDSVRFPSRDTAIEEGHFKVHNHKEQATTSKYTVLHVREGGKWLMAVVREFPSEGASIRDLDWLIGAWSAKRDDTEVHTTYEWWGEKNFIRVNFAIKTKEKNITGFQMIAKDSVTGQIRSWAFDPDGSFGEASWTREGKKWMQDSAAVLPDGATLAATNIFTQIDNDTFTFQSVERSLDGVQLPDIGPIRVMRIKAKE